MPSGKPIGNPLEKAATLGKLGGKRETSESSDTQASSSLNVSRRPSVQTLESSSAQTPKRLSIQESSHLDAQMRERSAIETSRRSGAQASKHPDWKKQTSYLPEEIQSWLRVHSAATRLEISEIIVEALEDYRAKQPKHF